MTYSAMQVANAFIRRAQDGKIKGLTPMKLQKLMFFAQSWYLKKFESRLFDDNFERWKHGPVIPSVYHEFSTYGGAEITEYAKNAQGEDFDGRLATQDENFIETILNTYGDYTGWQLSWITHQKGTAWHNGWKNYRRQITDQELYDGLV